MSDTTGTWTTGLDRIKTMAIDPKQIDNLLAIAEHGSFMRAAAAQGMSQPALSSSIAQLERRLGVKVLDRSRRGSVLNGFGQILVRRARSMKALLTQAEREIRLHSMSIEGPLVIGATPGVLNKLLPEAIRLLAANGGRMDVSIIEGAPCQLFPALLSGELDVLVGPVFGATTESADVMEEALVDDSYCIAVGWRSEYADRECLNIAELSSAPWVLPQPGTPCMRQIEPIFLAANLPWPTDCLTSNSLSLIREIVCISNRISIFSRMQIFGPGDERFRGIPLEGALPRPLGFKVRRDAKRSPIAERFLLALRQAAVQSVTYAASRSSSSYWRPSAHSENGHGILMPIP